MNWKLSDGLHRLRHWGRTGEFEKPGTSSLLSPTVCLKDTPLISVIMTVHNSDAWLHDAIESIASQTWRHLEIILVDDKSSDDSTHVAERAQAKDSRIRLIRLERNVGTYQAKNVGIASCHGDAITFADSDDTCHPDRLARQLDALRTPGLVATTCNYVRHTADGTVVLNQGLRERLALISLMVKREVVDEIGWFDGVRTSADYEYFQRMRSVYGRPAHVNVDAPLYLALYRDRSLTTDGVIGTHLASNEANLLSEPRRKYVEAFTAWHEQSRQRGRRPYMPRSPQGRPFEAPPELLVR